jgi:F-type H+-transporting ATPase subunit a
MPVQLTPDVIELFRIGPVTINLTIALTWLIMLLLVAAARGGTRALRRGTDPSGLQLGLEIVVEVLTEQIRTISPRQPERLVPFVGTLFLYIVTANVLAIVPGYIPPTGSLSTTAALALCVLVAVPYFGISEHGLGGYLKQYAQPNVVMLPFNIIGELSRTLSLAIRLFGNVMSGTLIAGVLIAVAPFLFHAVMQAFGLLTGIIQAYIFAVLATVYIASAIAAHEEVVKVRATTARPTSPRSRESERNDSNAGS